ncbi:hypothetical protein GCK32_019975, partial [Trichostrongylus colubriformis]
MGRHAPNTGRIHMHSLAHLKKHLEDARKREVAIDLKLGSDAEQHESTQKRKRTKKKRNSDELPSMMTAPKHVHGGDWKDMLHITNQRSKKVD